MDKEKEKITIGQCTKQIITSFEVIKNELSKIKHILTEACELHPISFEIASLIDLSEDMCNKISTIIIIHLQRHLQWEFKKPIDKKEQ